MTTPESHIEVPAPVARGKPLDRTDADLERLAEVTPEDVADARAFWEAEAPPGFRDLLDADLDAEEG